MRAAAARCHRFSRWLTHNRSVCPVFGKTETGTVAQCAFYTKFHTKPPRRVYFCELLWKEARTRTTFAADRENGPRTRGFGSVPFLLECLAQCLNGYSAGWLRVKLRAKFNSLEFSLFQVTIFALSFWIFCFNIVHFMA